MGIGLREEHLDGVLRGSASLEGIDWIEFITEEVMVPGGRWVDALDKVRAQRPVGLHGLFAGLGNREPNAAYEAELVELVERVQPALVSDHLCWSSYKETFAYDLLPLPHSAAAIERVVSNIQRLQDKLQRRLLIENTSVYICLAEHEMSELEFVQQVLERADCHLLLDVNNVVVNAKNLGFSADDYVDSLDPARIRQVHLAGHTDRGDYLYDTHVGPVPEQVWSLYKRVVHRTGPVSTLIEWDAMVPNLEVLSAEVERAKEIRATVTTPPQPVLPDDAPSAFRARLSSKNDEALHEVQERFWRAMRGDEGALPSSPGLDAYRELFRGRRLDQLIVDYGALGTHMGEDAFMALAARFIDLGIGRQHHLRSLSDEFYDFLPYEALDDFARGLAGLDRARSQLQVEPEYVECDSFAVAAHRFVELPDVLVLMWRQGYEVADRATSVEEQLSLQACIAKKRPPTTELRTRWQSEGLLKSR